MPPGQHARVRGKLVRLRRPTSSPSPQAFAQSAQSAPISISPTPTMPVTTTTQPQDRPSKSLKFLHLEKLTTSFDLCLAKQSERTAIISRNAAKATYKAAKAAHEASEAAYEAANEEVNGCATHVGEAQERFRVAHDNILAATEKGAGEW